MINPAQTPDEVVDAACRAYTEIMLDIAPESAIEAAIAAALAAWPGMTWACRGKGTPPHLLFLPLPQEASDE
jgi:hypothetical protein